MTEDDRILLEAGGWVEVLDRRALDVSKTHAFDAWIEADPRHASAFSRIERLWDSEELVEALKASQVSDDLALSNDDSPAFDDVHGDEAIPAQSAKRFRLLPLAVAASIGFLLLSIFPLTDIVEWQTYRSAKGEVEEFSLADGTTIELAPASEVSVRILPWSRHVELTHGEAFFEVNHDRWTDFTVTSDQGRITVLGTAFNVDLQEGGDLTVQVYRGSVRFGASGMEDVVIRAGSEGRVSNNTFSLSQMPSDQSDPEWMHGWFEAKETPLRSVIAKANRYSEFPISTKNPADLDRMVTGRFKISDVDMLESALYNGYDIEIISLYR